MGQKTENTNLACEYYVLSLLYRKGIDAAITVGNKKSIDIVVQRKNRSLTIDVKGLKGKSSFPVDNISLFSKSHFIVFVSFLGKINESKTVPEIYVVPSMDVTKIFKELNGKCLIYKNPKGNRQVVPLSCLRKLSRRYSDNWALFY